MYIIVQRSLLRRSHYNSEKNTSLLKEALHSCDAELSQFCKMFSLNEIKALTVP